MGTKLIRVGEDIIDVLDKVNERSYSDKIRFFLDVKKIKIHFDLHLNHLATLFPEYQDTIIEFRKLIKTLFDRTLPCKQSVKHELSKELAEKLRLLTRELEDKRI